MTHARVAADEDAQSDRDSGVDSDEQRGQRHVDEGPVDEPLDRVQAVARDRHADGSGRRDPDSEDQGEHDPVDDRDPERVTQQTRQDAQQEHDRNEADRPGEPERLQSLDSCRPTEPQPDRVCAKEEADEHPEQEREERRADPQRFPDDVACEGVGDGRVGGEGRRIDHRERDEPPEAEDRERHDPAPARREQATVREHEGDRDRPGIEQRPRSAIELERPSFPERGPERALDSERERPEEQDPGNEVPRLTVRDEQPHQGRREERRENERVEPNRNPIVAVTTTQGVEKREERDCAGHAEGGDPKPAHTRHLSPLAPRPQ